MNENVRCDVGDDKNKYILSGRQHLLKKVQTIFIIQEIYLYLSCMLNLECNTDIHIFTYINSEDAIFNSKI